MITRITIPQAFENMEEATIGVWLKAEGDAVSPGDALCELITEKTTFPLEAEGAGVLLHIAAGEKSIVPVGAIIGVIGESSEAVPDIEAENVTAHARASTAKAGVTKEATSAAGAALSVPSLSAPTLSVPALSVPAASGAGVAPSAGGAGAAPGAGGSRVRATPAARRAARERGIAIEDVAAAFPGKVLSEEDIARFPS